MVFGILDRMNAIATRAIMLVVMVQQTLCPQYVMRTSDRWICESVNSYGNKTVIDSTNWYKWLMHCINQVTFPLFATPGHCGKERKDCFGCIFSDCCAKMFASFWSQEEQLCLLLPRFRSPSVLMVMGAMILSSTMSGMTGCVASRVTAVIPFW